MPRIVTTYVCPPIPMRAFDWEACIEGREGDEDAPRGFGFTKAQAITDLLDQLDEASA